LNSLKLQVDLADSKDTAFLSMVPGSVHDMHGLHVDGLSIAEPLPTRQFTEDSTSPVLQSFALDLTAETLTLRFDETMNASSLVPQQITVQSAEDATDAVSFVLTGDAQRSYDATSIQFKLLLGDLNAIKAEVGLAVSGATTYLGIRYPIYSDVYAAPYAFLPSGVEDMNHNAVTRIHTKNATNVASYTVDGTAPKLLSFSVDLNNGVLGLTFDETVNSTSLQASKFALQARANGGDGVPLTNGVVDLAVYTTVLTLGLVKADLDEVKRVGVCTPMGEGCFMVFKQGAISDMAGNEIKERPASNGLNVTAYAPDFTAPKLVSFTEFDLERGILDLSFDETIVNTSFVPTAVVLRSFYVGRKSSLRLSGGVVTTPSGTSLKLKMSHADVLRVKNNVAICTERATCWIELEAAGV
jgi:hypothetical protein